MRILRNNPILIALALALAAAAFGAFVRYQFYEPAEFGAICYERNPWWCVFRTFIAIASKNSGFGWTAVVLALIASWHVWRGRSGLWLALASIFVGGVGVLLYDATVSTPALLLAALLIVRAPERRTSQPR